MRNSVVFISGGIWQKPFVEFLKEKKHFVAIVNPVDTCTTRVADYHIKCDINDTKEIEKHIEKIKPIFITSDQSDVSTKIVSELNEKFNLRGSRPDIINKFSNKYDIYKFGKNININVPNTKIINSVEDLIDFGDKNNYPIIIKPIDSTMSRGFKKINSKLEINSKIIEDSLLFSKSKKIIAQNYVSGDMVTCEGVCSGGEHVTLATSIKISSEYFEPGITSKVNYPFCNKIVEEIKKTNDFYVKKSGLEFGLTHSEYIVNNNNFCLLEIGARGGGAGISNLITPWVSGVDNYEIFYKSLMGESYDLSSINLLNRHAILRYYREKDVSESQANKIKNIKGVATFNYNFLGTQYIFDKNDCRYSMGIFLAENEEKMKDLAKKIKKYNVEL